MKSELIVKLRTESDAGAHIPDGQISEAATRDGHTFHQFLRAERLTTRPLRPRSSSRPGAPVVSLARENSSEGARHLDAFWSLAARAGEAERMRAVLAGLPEVEAAFIVPAPEVVPPPTLPSTGPTSGATPSFRHMQGYLDPAPGGVDAVHAWTRPGGRGTGIRLIDVEGDWQLDHEAITGRVSSKLSLFADRAADWEGAHDAFLQHGTSVLGQLIGTGEDAGICGISSEVDIGVVSHMHRDSTGEYLGSASAISSATDLLRPGDLMLLEMHMPGPRYSFTAMRSQEGYIAVEWWEHLFAAIRDATDKGIIVVEAAGNGWEDLDDDIYEDYRGFSASWRNPFRRAGDGSRDSGAIIVGAGSPPACPVDRSRLPFSNFGEAVDAQAWGREVVTSGGGDLQGGDKKRWYTRSFSGTSSAAPIVAGALACVQGALLASGRPLLTPGSARSLLRGTGSVQQPDVQVPPGMGRIGNRPDLRLLILEAFAQADASA